MRGTGALVVAAMLDFLTFALCAPYSETTEGKQFDVLLEKVADRGRTLYRLFQQPSHTIVKVNSVKLTSFSCSLFVLLICLIEPDRIVLLSLCSTPNNYKGLQVLRRRVGFYFISCQIWTRDATVQNANTTSLPFHCDTSIFIFSICETAISASLKHLCL